MTPPDQPSTDLIAFTPESFRVESRAAHAPPSHTKYNPELALRILEAHAGGASLVRVAKHIGIHHSTILRWGAIYPDFGKALKEARIAAGHASDEAALEVLEKPMKSRTAVGKAREIASHHRWRAERYAPDDYGRQLALNVAGSLGLDHTIHSEAPAWLGVEIDGKVADADGPADQDIVVSPSGWSPFTH